MTGRRSNHDAAHEVLCRAAALQHRSKQWLRRALAGAGALCFALLVWRSARPGLHQASEPHSAQGNALALAAGATAGGYVLVGVICFALGIALTLICLKYLEKKNKK